MNNIRVVLPEKYNLVTGDTFQLFFRGVVEAPNPFCYDIVSVCNEGKHFPRYFEFTPEKPGSHLLTISVYDADKNLLGQGKTILEVKEAKSPEKPLNILCIGDSLTSGGQWVSECNRRLTASGGMPAGNNLTNINFIGGCEKNGTKFEAYGGWKWTSFTSTSYGGIWVISMGHIRTIKDQHSIWADEDGNLWQLETISVDMIKFMRHGNHEGTLKNGTYLTHFSDAHNKDSILIEGTLPETVSPFLDQETKNINLKKYCNERGFSGIDVVYVLLGYNGLHTAKVPLREHCNTIINEAKKLVDTIHMDFPEAKVVVSGLYVPSVIGGMGANYGAKLPYCDIYGMTRFVMDLNIAYEKWTKEEGYNNFMEFVNLSGQFDTDYNLPGEEKPVNTRSKVTEWIGTNGVHPIEEGYMQIADAMYRSMIHIFNE